MTAFETFWRYAAQETLPTAVPVESSDSDLSGIVTTSFDIRQNAEALAVATSSDPAERALCAVYACHAARLAAEQMLPEIYPAP